MGGGGLFSAGRGPGPQLLTKESSEGDCDSDRFSQSQCLGTLCLKGEGGREPRGKRDRLSSFPTYILGLLIASWLSSGMDKSRKSIKC